MNGMGEPPEGAEPWQVEAWKHMDKISAELSPLFGDLGFFPRGYGLGLCSIDPDEFEAAIIYARDEYERVLGVVPTEIDLPNWVRGTILEQIAFTNGFNIADRREE